MPKPELGPIAVGDHMLVIPATYSHKPSEAIEAAITKADRVWIELEEVNPRPSRPRAWRMRRDTQDDGTDGIRRNRFLTHEQYAWHERRQAAYVYLMSTGIRLEGSSPWSEPDRQVELANLLRRHEGLPEL
jgi:hypothetical protein